MEIDKLNEGELKSLCGELSTQVSLLTTKLERAMSQLNDKREDNRRYIISLMTWVVENERSLPHSLYELAIEEIEKYITWLIESSSIDNDAEAGISLSKK